MNGQNELVPRCWRGWMVSLAGLVITFGLYYLWAYEPILQQYQTVFLQKPASASSIPGLEKVSVIVFRPTTLAFTNFVEREMVVRMENRGPTEAKFTLTALPQSDSEFLRIRSESSLESDEYSSAFDVTIPPQSIREIALYLSVEHVEDTAQTRDFKMNLYVNGVLLSFGASALDFSYDPLQAFRESLIKFLLFPPFSNVFLASMVFFIVGWVERRKNSLLFSWIGGQSDKKILSRLNHPQWLFPQADWSKWKRDVSEIIAWLASAGLLFVSLSLFMVGILLQIVWFLLVFGLLSIFFLSLLLFDIKS